MYLLELEDIFSKGFLYLYSTLRKLILFIKRLFKFLSIKLNDL